MPLFFSIGNSDDGALQLIESIGSPNIKIVHTPRDESLREGGRVLAVETEKALAHVPAEYDRGFYLQADEVVHEKNPDTVVQAATRYVDDKKVDGVLFHYLHFYNTCDYAVDSRR